ncbi:glycosyltransferase [Muriicola sp. Z0-33]|uniref:glycosyltransferase n=1 Tax=Muriicola sp. Z0-33 TaxID=2816957 RepID=UPI0022381EDE|nr:glycosyltransferase [Muriicola sp. Z0-33]MCW5516369.1 glycosyltransferase family 1 protein [Muriicola sp. Z0-33]
MKILLLSIGTRGDMEPFLAIGEQLSRLGHEIVCAFPEQFRSLVEDSGFRFLSLGKEFIEMLESPFGKAAMGGSATTWKKINAYIKLAKTFAPMRKRLMVRQFTILEEESPDRLVYHAKAVYGYIWELTHPGQNVLIFPVPYTMHPAKEYSHIVFNRNLGSLGNILSYKLARLGLVKTIVKDAKALSLPYRITPRLARKALDTNKAAYTLSPSLFTKPESWPDHAKVLGYHERNKNINWEPDTALQAFLREHSKFLLITFGSMTNPNPVQKTQLIVRKLEQLGIPAIINTAGGGLVKIDDLDSSLIVFVHRIPYDFILPKTYGIVHHGGSGTSHMAVKHGCVSLIIPHIIDQFFWNKLLSGKGVGPKGPSITNLDAKNIGPLLSALWSDAVYKENSKQLAAEMAKEQFEDKLAAFILGKSN